MTALCPSCGHNLQPPEPLVDGPFEYDGVREVRFNGIKLKVSRQPALLIGALMRLQGRTLFPDAVLNLIGYDGECERDFLKVLISHARKAIREAGGPDVIETVWGTGYRWRRPK